jgi:hypothetical protein
MYAKRRRRALYELTENGQTLSPHRVNPVILRSSILVTLCPGMNPFKDERVDDVDLPTERFVSVVMAVPELDQVVVNALRGVC